MTLNVPFPTRACHMLLNTFVLAVHKQVKETPLPTPFISTLPSYYLTQQSKALTLEFHFSPSDQVLRIWNHCARQQ